MTRKIKYTIKSLAALWLLLFAANMQAQMVGTPYLVRQKCTIPVTGGTQIGNMLPPDYAFTVYATVSPTNASTPITYEWWWSPDETQVPWVLLATTTSPSYRPENPGGSYQVRAYNDCTPLPHPVLIAR